MFLIRDRMNFATQRPNQTFESFIRNYYYWYEQSNDNDDYWTDEDEEWWLHGPPTKEWVDWSIETGHPFLGDIYCF